MTRTLIPKRSSVEKVFHQDNSVEDRNLPSPVFIECEGEVARTLLALVTCLSNRSGIRHHL